MIKNAHYYQPRCVLCKKKTFGYVTQNMPSGMIGLIDFYLTLFHALI